MQLFYQVKSIIFEMANLEFKIEKDAQSSIKLIP